MTREERQLLTVDICGRLPYGVRVLVSDAFPYSTIPGKNAVIKVSDIHDLIAPVSLDERYNKSDKVFSKIIQEHTEYLEFKPYLRPMSSMTEEEKNEYFGRTMTIDIVETSQQVIDWLLKHHFDYRGLIEKGLALEAPDGMYK